MSRSYLAYQPIGTIGICTPLVFHVDVCECVVSRAYATFKGDDDMKATQTINHAVETPHVIAPLAFLVGSLAIGIVSIVARSALYRWRVSALGGAQ